MNTKLQLMYRDADNYKAHCDVVLEGEISAEEIAAIAANLDEGYFLIAEQVNLPTPGEQFLGKDPFPNEDLDHVWTTLVDFETEERPAPAALLTHDAATPGLKVTIHDLAKVIAHATWDVPKEWQRLRDLAKTYACQSTQEVRRS